MSKAKMLKAGDRVRISKDSEYYKEGSESNPKGVTGTISEIEEDEYCYRVDWDNGESNTYRINDLYLYQEIKVGDRVRISKDSIYYKDGQESNPRNVTGTVNSVGASYSLNIHVKWDNLRSNSYNVKDLYLYSEKDKKSNELTVSKEFVLEAHKAACSDWKNKLEKQFPEVFESDKYPTLVDLKEGDRIVAAELFVKVRDSKGNDKYVPLKGVEIADGIADGRILPQQAKYKALYIRPELLGFGEYEIKHKATDSRCGSHVVYFEKK